MTQQKVKLLYSSFAVESMVDIQLHSKCLKQLGWPLSVVELRSLWALYWCMDPSNFREGSDISVGKFIPFGWVTSFIRAQNREWCAAVIFLEEFPCFFNFSSQHTSTWICLRHTYTHSRAPNICHLLTNSSRQYHLLIHYIKQILSMKRWLNWVRTWPTNLYRGLKWRQMKPISLWDTDLQILLSVLSWDIVCS